MRSDEESLDVVLVGDLHLGAHAKDVQTRYLRGLAAFLRDRQEQQRQAGRRWRLVLLGDTVDFAVLAAPTGSSRAAARARTGRALERALGSGPELAEALGWLLARGVPVDVVAGNHDAELTHPDTQVQLGHAIGGGREVPGLRVHPWVFYVPGVVYAEHGSQHHDINRLPDLARRTEELAAGRPLTPAALLSVHRHHGSGRRAGAPRVPPVAALMKMLLRTWWEDGRVRHRGGAVPESSLEPGLAQELWQVSRVRPLSPVLRVAVRLLRGADAVGTGRYMYVAAQRIHDVMSAAGDAVPCYVFAHTHQAERVDMAGWSPSTYVNTGTWSPSGRGRDVPEGYVSFVHVDGTDGRSTLGAWQV